MRLSYYSFDSLGNPWVSGGGALRDFEVLKRLARHARVTLYVGRYPGFQDREEQGVRIRGLGFGASNWLCRVSYAILANLRLLFDRSDKIGMSPSIYAPVLTGLLQPRRNYIVFHHYVGKRSIEKLGPLGAIPWLCEIAYLRLGKRYVAINAAVEDRIRRSNPNADIIRNANGFDPTLLSNPRTVPGTGAADAPPYILFVGRFDVYMKGLDLLIAAWAEGLASRGIDLVLAGRASQGDLHKITTLVPEPLKERVRLESPVTEERKRELLSGCLYFASPSRFEGFGIAALEANAAGVAVLATDNEGFRESLKSDVTALTPPVGDLEALRAAMIRLADDAGLRESMGRAGREHARAFSWDAIADVERDWVFERPSHDAPPPDAADHRPLP